jgi:anhydro-N-acetylmuramic acid kinase
MDGRQIIGLMSGTSLDGLDIVLTEFHRVDEKYSFDIKHAKTYKWSKKWQNKLAKAKSIPASKMIELDKLLGKEFARLILRFLEEFDIEKSKVAAIASHGHTIFHQPQKGYSYQIGCGTTIAFETGINVINDFRNKDIIAGGQGAPLVPIGDKLLFSSQADAFLNLGGIANITYRKTSKTWVAYDICPCNIPLNQLAKQKNLKFDKGGKIASKGQISFFLLDLLNRLPYYHQAPPKSLGMEWIEDYFYPMIKFSNSTKDNLCTIVEHIAIQIAEVLEQNKIKTVMITGGGAKNDYLLKRIQHHSRTEIFVPDAIIVDFKEALIFAFLGELYLLGEDNTIPTVTGAKKATVSGVLHLS